MILVRVASGIRSHWHMRATEWVLVFPAVGVGLALLYQADLFNTSPSFAQVGRWASQTTWAVCVLFYAMTRLIALTVNGTFDGFRYSPHMRLGASVVGLLFWSQYTLGLIAAAAINGGAWSGPVVYMTLCLMELLNIYRSSADISRAGR